MGKVEVFTRLGQRVINMGDKLRWDVQLPAELANVGDSGGSNPRVPQFNLPTIAEGKALVRKIIRGHGLQ